GAPAQTTTGYELDASTASNFTGTLISSVTSVPSLNTLSFNYGSLNPNTTYYVRVGALYSGATTYNTATQPTTSTLTNLLNNVSYFAVHSPSISVSWSAFAVGPGTSTSEGYELDASTASDFSGTLISSVTTSVTFSTMTVGLSTQLNPNTT